MVTDFGIAKALADSKRPDGAAPSGVSIGALTAVGMSVGTPAYIAETGGGRPMTDPRRHLRVWLHHAYEALTGRPPFTAASLQRMPRRASH